MSRFFASMRFRVATFGERYKGRARLNGHSTNRPRPSRGNAFPWHGPPLEVSSSVGDGRSGTSRIPRKLAIRMTRETLELVFLSSALLGSTLLLLASLGATLHVHVHMPVHVPVHMPHLPMHFATLDNATLWPMLLGFLSMFG